MNDGGEDKNIETLCLNWGVSIYPLVNFYLIWTL